MPTSPRSSEPSLTGAPHLSTVQVRYDARTETTTYSPVVPHGDSVLWTAELPLEHLGTAEFACLELELGGVAWRVPYGEGVEQSQETEGVTVVVKWHEPTSVNLLVRNDSKFAVERILHVQPVFKVGAKTFTAPDPQIVLPPEKKPG